MDLFKIPILRHNSLKTFAFIKAWAMIFWSTPSLRHKPNLDRTMMRFVTFGQSVTQTLSALVVGPHTMVKIWCHVSPAAHCQWPSRSGNSVRWEGEKGERKVCSQRANNFIQLQRAFADCCVVWISLFGSQEVLRSLFFRVSYFEEDFIEEETCVARLKNQRYDE